MRIPVPWVYVLMYLVGVGLELRLRPAALPVSPAIIVGTGVVLFVMGAALAGWGLLLFRNARTTAVPGQTSSKLVTQGPYRFSRNPMYVGLAFAYLGEAGILKQVWPIALLPLVLAYINWIVIPVEEARLREAFGAEYEQYRAVVRRWI